jgi:hypothetical protein
MSELKKSGTADPHMYLDARSPDGHIVVCTGDGTEHSFLRRHLGLSVECPVCGQTALSVELLAAFYSRTVANPAWRGCTTVRDHDARLAPKQRFGDASHDCAVPYRVR